MLLAIDPGVSAGWALFGSGGRLVACGCPKVPEPTWPINVLVIEKPRAYPRSPVDANNLITLALQVGRFVERFGAGADVHLPEPRDWKAQISKEAHHPRIWAACTPEEQDLIRAAGAGKNQKAVGDLMDAVGLGKWSITQGWYR